MIPISFLKNDSVRNDSVKILPRRRNERLANDRFGDASMETRAWRREHGELERLSEQPKRIFPRVSRLHAPRFFLSDRPMKRLGDPFNCPALVRLFQKILR